MKSRLVRKESDGSKGIILQKVAMVVCTRCHVEWNTLQKCRRGKSSLCSVFFTGACSEEAHHVQKSAYNG